MAQGPAPTPGARAGCPQPQPRLAPAPPAPARAHGHSLGSRQLPRSRPRAGCPRPRASSLALARPACPLQPAGPAFLHAPTSCSRPSIQTPNPHDPASKSAFCHILVFSAAAATKTRIWQKSERKTAISPCFVRILHQKRGCGKNRAPKLPYPRKCDTGRQKNEDVAISRPDGRCVVLGGWGAAAGSGGTCGGARCRGDTVPPGGRSALADGGACWCATGAVRTCLVARCRGRRKTRGRCLRW